MARNSKVNGLAVVGLLIAAASLGWAIYAHYSHPADSALSIPLKTIDNKGHPGKVVLVGPDGAQAFTGIDGCTWVPKSWVNSDKRIEVLSARDRRPLAVVSLVTNSYEVKLVVPSDE